MNDISKTIRVVLIEYYVISIISTVEVNYIMYWGI